MPFCQNIKKDITTVITIFLSHSAYRYVLAQKWQTQVLERHRVYWFSLSPDTYHLLG
uniref:Uncharacterized protein n=1 Tax=Anguilla anguilla TaxID=7936 RepID=A0A0E9XHT9_ANGAN